MMIMKILLKSQHLHFSLESYTLLLLVVKAIFVKILLKRIEYIKDYIDKMFSKCDF